MKTIDSFRGEYRFLSNYWPVKVVYEGIEYPSVEQAYKAAQLTNIEARMLISNLFPNRKELEGQMEEILKQYGIRIDWNDELRLKVMEELLIQKFNDGEIRRKLRDTKDALLIEGNTWHDTFFGVCDGVGENYLGKLLMKIRESLR
jgi:ribA/ribD-fused uncharacterized protein